MTLNVQWLFVPDRLVRVFKKTADLLGFSLATISRVYREWYEKEKISERGSCVDENALLRLERNGPTG